MLTVLEIENEIKHAIKASNGDDIYMVGLRNGMRFCLSLIDGNAPEYETVSKAEGAEELPKAYTLELLNNLKEAIEKEGGEAYSTFCLSHNDAVCLAYDSYSAYVAALETAIRCVEEGAEE